MLLLFTLLLSLFTVFLYLILFMCSTNNPLVILSVSVSNPSKGPELSNVMAPEESALDDKNDRQREEEKEADTDTPDGSALPSVAQKRAQEKHRYNTVGYQVLNIFKIIIQHCR